MTAALERTALLIQQDIYPELEFDAITEVLTSQRVRLRAEPPELADRAVQTALVTAAISSAQSGARLVLDFPEVALAGPQPPLAGDALREGLIHATGEMIVRALADDGGPADVTLLFGGAPARRGDGLALRVSADEFGWTVTRPDEAPLGGAAGSPFGPIGAGFAGAAEAFRAAAVRIGERYGLEPLRQHRVGPFRRVAGRLPGVVLPRRVELGKHDAISGGAIMTGALFCLLRVIGVSAFFRIFDDDLMGETNLNRYPLLTRRYLGWPKPDVLAEACAATIDVEPVCERYDEEVARRVGTLREAVVVGVDDIPSRWRAQASAPGWVCIGGTSHFAAIVSEHIPGGPCGGCLHPADDPGETAIPTCSFVSGFAGLLQAHRIVAHALGVAPARPVLAYPFNLGAQRAVREIGMAARRDCPIGCEASAAV